MQSEDPKEFVDRHSDIDNRVTELRADDIVGQHNEVFWGFIIWDLGVLKSPPLPTQPNYGLSAEDLAVLRSTRHLTVYKADDAEDYGVSNLDRRMYEWEPWVRMTEDLGIPATVSNFKVRLMASSLPESIVNVLLESDDIDPKEFVSGVPGGTNLGPLSMNTVREWMPEYGLEYDSHGPVQMNGKPYVELRGRAYGTFDFVSQKLTDFLIKHDIEEIGGRVVRRSTDSAGPTRVLQRGFNIIFPVEIVDA